MLVGDRFRESSRKEIVLHDIDSDAFRYFLDFLYNGNHFYSCNYSFLNFSSVSEQIPVNPYHNSDTFFASRKCHYHEDLQYCWMNSKVFKMKRLSSSAMIIRLTFHKQSRAMWVIT